MTELCNSGYSFGIVYQREHLEQALSNFLHIIVTIRMAYWTLLLFSFDIQVCNMKHGCKLTIIFSFIKHSISSTKTKI